MRAIFCVLLLASACSIFAAEVSRDDYMADLAVTNRPPADLEATYIQLVRAMKSGDKSAIIRLSATDAIKITTAQRVEASKEDGRAKEINLPFAARDLDSHIILARKDSATNYLLRTTTTAFWFTKNANGEWKLTDYIDKSIE